MKSFLPFLMAILLATGCATVHRLDSNKYEVIPVPQGIQDPTTLQKVAQRVTNGLPVIFKVGKGEQMPVKLGVDLPMGALEKAQLVFAFTNDTYFLLSQKGLQLSPDGQHWASITSPKSMAKVFGFKRGDFSFGFAATTNEPPYINLNIQVK